MLPSLALRQLQQFILHSPTPLRLDYITYFPFDVLECQIQCLVFKRMVDRHSLPAKRMTTFATITAQLNTPVLIKSGTLTIISVWHYENDVCSLGGTQPVRKSIIYWLNLFTLYQEYLVISTPVTVAMQFGHHNMGPSCWIVERFHDQCN